MGEFDRLVGIEVDIGQQVDLVQQQQVGGGEHVGILERLVLALGHREDHHLARLAEVEGGRADEVADVLDQQQRAVRQRQARQRLGDHLRVEMAALAGIDLQRGDARGANPLGVEVGLLVALDHRDRHFAAKSRDAAA